MERGNQSQGMSFWWRACVEDASLRFAVEFFLSVARIYCQVRVHSSSSSRGVALVCGRSPDVSYVYGRLLMLFHSFFDNALGY